MNQIRFLAALAAIHLAVGAAPAAETPPGKPNIIWLMAEDMGQDLECYGMAGVKTPNLNKLAEEGARYTEAYCSNPICSPNRSSMMVGVDQTVINAQHHRSNRDVSLMEPYKPITYWLREAGYTCILGNTQVMGQGRKIDCNFKYEETGAYDGKTKFGIFDKLDEFTPADQPFFAQIQLQATHRGDWWEDVRKQSKHPVSTDAIKLPPYMADTPEIRLDWASYCDQIEYMDNEVGLLMQELKSKGLDKNTVVIFIADNGRCNLRGKGYLYEPGLHIPLIVWAPGMVKRGTVIDDLVVTTDISASVLNLAGATIPDYITSRPFIGVEKPDYRKYVRSARDIWDEIDECSRSITTGQFSYISNHMPEVPWVTSQAYLELNRPAIWSMRHLKAEGKLSETEMTFFKDEKPKEELYDLKKDPDQLHNLAENPEYADVLKGMRGHEAEWVSANRDFGLEDLGRRHPEEGLSAVVARDWVKKNDPKLWKRLENGELLPTHSWSKLGKKQKRQKSE